MSPPSVDQIATRSLPPAASFRRSPRWLSLYFLLAGCLLFVLLASLYFNHRLSDLQADAVRASREWAQRNLGFIQLGRLAADVNMPGNDVFQSGDPRAESANLNAALHKFNEALERAKSDVVARVGAPDDALLLENLTAIDQGVQKMAGQASAVFTHFQADPAQAGEHMAAMDRANKQVRDASYDLHEAVIRIRQQAYDRQDAARDSLANFEYALNGGTALVALGVVAYAIALSRKIAAAHRIDEQNLALLQASQEALQRETAAAAQASRAKSNFLANMSHEIRTPMTAVMGYAELLLDPDRTDGERTEAVQVIRRSARHLLELINDILDISKIEADRMTVERIPTDVPQIVADVASLVRPSAIAKELTFTLTFGQAVPRTILSDPIRLRQVLVNLVGNALKFTARGEIRLHVDCEVRDGLCYSVFEVADTGIGMSDEQIGRIFQPFTQADDSTTRRFGGTGLGLTISQHLVELMGGQLAVKSIPGLGSQFRFKLPAGPAGDVDMVSGYSESMLAASPSAEKQSIVTLRGRVLLAEDGPDNQRLIAGHLRNAGAEVVVAENGRVAVDLAQSQTFDLILMDMQMPELDGYAATHHLRTRGMTLPIVALTAHAMAEDREKCLVAGCTDYLTKPIEKQSLLLAVAGYLPLSTTAEADAAPPPSATPSAATATVRSTLAADPSMRPLIEEFVASLPERVANISQLLDGQQLSEACRQVHQLKGAGGGFGFADVTRLAAIAERSLQENQPLDMVRADVAALIDFIRSIESYDLSREPSYA